MSSRAKKTQSFEIFSSQDLNWQSLVKAFAKGDEEIFRFHTSKKPEEIDDFIQNNYPDTRYHHVSDGIVELKFDSETMGLYLIKKIAGQIL